MRSLFERVWRVLRYLCCRSYACKILKITFSNKKKQELIDAHAFLGYAATHGLFLFRNSSRTNGTSEGDASTLGCFPHLFLISFALAPVTSAFSKLLS